MSVPSFIVCLVVTFLFAGVFFRLFFENREEFFDCLGSALTPDFVSIYRGEFLEDLGRSWKLNFYFFVASIPGMIAAFAVEELIGFLESGDPSRLSF